MEYVIACFVKNEGKVYYSDKPASKAQAQKWANKNAKELGGIWFVVPAAVAEYYDPAIFQDPEERGGADAGYAC